MLGPTLKGTSVTLAPIRPEHFEDYCRWFADPRVTRYLNIDTPPTLKQEEEWFERVARSDREVVWGLFADGQHVGSISIGHIDWRNRRGVTGIVIGDAQHWGRGLATQAMQLRTRYAFEELGLHKLITHVFGDNVASRRALEHAGYRTAGTYRQHEYRLGRWWDVWIGELLSTEWQSNDEGGEASSSSY